MDKRTKLAWAFVALCAIALAVYGIGYQKTSTLTCSERRVTSDGIIYLHQESVEVETFFSDTLNVKHYQLNVTL